MTTATNVPSAQGTVQTKRSNNGNTQLEVRVKHLAEPNKVASDSTTYVVWAKPKTADEPPTNLGALKVDNELEGEFKAVTPLKQFDLFITPESSPTARTPSHERVLSVEINEG